MLNIVGSATPARLFVLVLSMSNKIKLVKKHTSVLSQNIVEGTLKNYSKTDTRLTYLNDYQAIVLLRIDNPSVGGK